LVAKPSSPLSCHMTIDSFSNLHFNNFLNKVKPLKNHTSD